MFYNYVDRKVKVNAQRGGNKLVLFERNSRTKINKLISYCFDYLISVL